MGESEPLEFNRAALEKEYDRGTFEVTTETIIDYTRAVGDTNLLYSNEKDAAEGPYESLVASPTMVALFSKAIEPHDLNVKFDGTSYMAGQWIEPKLPIRPGDVLKATDRVKDVYRKTGRSGPMVFVVVETSFVNQNGDLAAVVGWSSVRRK